MNLTVGEVAELPAAAALFDGVDVVAHTPEWRDAVPGTVTYRVRRARLVVDTDGSADPACAAVLDTLLREVEDAAIGLPRRQSLRVSMLAASLRAVAGRVVETVGTSADVLEHACAGIASRTTLHVAVVHDQPFAVLGPAVAALVLVQLATNAETHDGATSVTLSGMRHSFTVEWHSAGGRARPGTARRRADRERWGLGFARIAADSLGGCVHPPARGTGGVSTAALETGLNRLALPLALLRNGVVHKATRAWDEETALLPGRAVTPHGRAARCVFAAAGRPGTIATVEGWCARTGRAGTWVMIPPDGVVERARDVLDGMVHERALWDGIPEPAQSRIVALAAIVGSMLGVDLERVPGDTWNRRARAVADAYGLAMPVPVFHGVGAIDPRVALLLARECGEALEADGDELYLRVRPDSREHPLALALLAGGGSTIKLS